MRACYLPGGHAQLPMRKVFDSPLSLVQNLTACARGVLLQSVDGIHGRLDGRVDGCEADHGRVLLD
jgi:hypothetical protein